MAVTAPDLDRYRAGAEGLLAAPASDPGDLFDADALTGLEAAAAADPALRPLARFAAEGLLRAASAGEAATIDEVLRAPLVTGPDGPIALVEVNGRLADEPDAARRRELQSARLRVLSSRVMTPLADGAARRDEVARALGAASATALLARAAGVDPAPAAAAAARMLDATDEGAARALDRLAHAALGVAAGDLDAADLPRLASAPHLDTDLPAAAAAPAAARTREMLGMTGGPAVGVPAAARLAAFAETLRATGAALARAGASPRLPLEARLLADPALAGAAGRLFEGLVADPAWLARVVHAADCDAIARAAAGVRLLAARASAARVVGLGTADPDGVARALGIPWPAELAAADALAGLSPLDDLRARSLAAALRTHLRETHGERWFTVPAAGALLRELWLEGGRLDADALARELGAPGLDPTLVVAEAAMGPA